MRPQLFSCVLALAACGKADSAAPKAEPVAQAEPAAPTAAPAPAPARPARPAEPAVATILPISGYDPCSLVPDDLLAATLGGAPTQIERKRNNARVLREDEHSTAHCEWKGPKASAEIKLGSEDATRQMGREPLEPVSGLGDAAWLQNIYMAERNKHLIVKVGDLFLVIEVRGSSDNVAAMTKLAQAAVAALPTVASLADKLHKGDAVGGPGLSPCDLVSPEVLASTAGGGTYVTLPSEHLGAKYEHVSCRWIAKGEKWAEVSFRTAKAWEEMARRPGGLTVGGRQARLAEGGVTENLYVEQDGWTLMVGVNHADAKRSENQQRAVALAEAVLARLK